MKNFRSVLIFAILFVVCPSVLGQKYTTKDWKFIDPPGAVSARSVGVWKLTVIIRWEDSAGIIHGSVYKNGVFKTINHPNGVYGTYLVSIWETTVIGFYVGVDHNGHYFKCNDDGTGFSDLTVTSVYSLRNQKIAGLESVGGAIIYVCNIDGTEKTFFNAVDTTQTWSLCLGDNFIGGYCTRNYPTGLQTDGFVCDMLGNFRKINPDKVVLDPSTPHTTEVTAIGDGIVFGSYFVCGFTNFGSGFICKPDGTDWNKIDAPNTDGTVNRTPGTVWETDIFGAHEDKIVGMCQIVDEYQPDLRNVQRSYHAYIATIPELTPKTSAVRSPNWRMYE